jgi:serine/threonine protein phosphatase PrpC
MSENLTPFDQTIVPQSPVPSEQPTAPATAPPETVAAVPSPVAPEAAPVSFEAAPGAAAPAQAATAAPEATLLEPLANAAPVDAPAPAASPPADSQQVDTQPLTPAPPQEGSVSTSEAAFPTEPEPPRALTPGAFLRGEFEIKEVVARGFTNLYLADVGSYGHPHLKLIAERESLPSAPASTSTPAVTPAPPTGPSAPASPASEAWQHSVTDAREVAHGAEAGAMGAEAGIFDAPQTPALASEQAALATTPAPVASAPAAPAQNADALASPPLILAGEAWEQDGREYCVWEYEETTTLQDFRDLPHDEKYLQALWEIAQGLQWAHAQGRKLGLSRDVLRFDSQGHARFYGFSSPLTPEGPSPLEQLSGVNEFLLKHTFANSGTMRLDDPFAGLPLAQETKDFARRLDAQEFASFDEAFATLQVLASTAMLQSVASLRTDVGRERELNEDSGLVARCSRATHLTPVEWELYLVADGMGGHEGGEIASDLTVRTFHELLMSAPWDWSDNGAVRAGLIGAIDETNARVAALAEEPKYRASRARPGSTLTFGVRVGRRLWIGNVGDSRGYIWRNNTLTRATKDHSYVQTLIDSGAITEEEAFDHPEGSIITAHIGEARLRTRDLYERLVRPGDALLLVSDGVIDMLREPEIQSVVAPFLQSNSLSRGDDVCRALVDASNAAGGQDNITALCVLFF